MVTGGAGFIGSNLLFMLADREPDCELLNVDDLTYAANLLTIEPLEVRPNYRFARVDLADGPSVHAIVRDFAPDVVIHCAAETHVDRSIADPAPFVRSNLVGTFNLLEAARFHHARSPGFELLHVSTDEVYGALGEQGTFDEESRYAPSNPYSATKAGSDHLVRAYHRTYGLPVKITHCGNNYGPRQHPEKFVPLSILRALRGEAIPVYGTGRNMRDWIYVADHCDALWAVARRGRVGETYDIGTSATPANIDVARAICRLVARETGRGEDQVESLISFVPDRPGHDLRYALDSSKLRRELGWEPRQSFESGLSTTVRWYMGNKPWCDAQSAARIAA
jgi:dTDP-glucose 4,6-dehydratase